VKTVYKGFDCVEGFEVRTGAGGGPAAPFGRGGEGGVLRTAPAGEHLGRLLEQDARGRELSRGRCLQVAWNEIQILDNSWTNEKDKTRIFSEIKVRPPGALRLARKQPPRATQLPESVGVGTCVGVWAALGCCARAAGRPGSALPPVQRPRARPLRPCNRC
jgi:hypothetical protein